MDAVRVLVTGAGSGVGQGIVKSLRIGSLPVRIIAADISPMNAALYRADEAVLIPKVEESGALPIVMDIIRQARVNVVMIGSEFDLGFFSLHRSEIEKETGAVVIASTHRTVEIAHDKFQTAEFLKENGFPYAEVYVPKDAPDAIHKAKLWGYPVFLKARRGTSGRHVHLAGSDAELSAFYPTVPEAMLQRPVGVPRDELSYEYTCSIFKCRDGRVLGPFTSRRVLRGGHSWIVEVGDFQDFHPLLLEIGERLDVMGPLNVQLMTGVRGPVPFELNCRFSGTTAVRAYFGFNEPEMALRHFYWREGLESPRIRKGLAFRYSEEVFVEDKGADELMPPFPKGSVKSWF